MYEGGPKSAVSDQVCPALEKRVSNGAPSPLEGSVVEGVPQVFDWRKSSGKAARRCTCTGPHVRNLSAEKRLPLGGQCEHDHSSERKRRRGRGSSGGGRRASRAHRRRSCQFANAPLLPPNRVRSAAFKVNSDVQVILFIFCVRDGRPVLHPLKFEEPVLRGFR